MVQKNVRGRFNSKPNANSVRTHRGAGGLKYRQVPQGKNATCQSEHSLICTMVFDAQLEFQRGRISQSWKGIRDQWRHHKCCYGRRKNLLDPFIK